MKHLKTIAAAGIILLISVSCSVTRHIPTDYPALDAKYTATIGNLRSITYPTSIPGPSERRMYVYLPSDYDSTQVRYPVLYLLHGARGDEASWITQGQILPRIDSLVAEGWMSDMIIVFPNMNSYDSESDYAKSRHKGALESFFEVDGAVESSFVNDVVGAVDSIFRTIGTKESRAIAGLSLGGMQALHISASVPQVFGFVGILSAPVHSALRKGPYSSFYDGIDGKIDIQFSDPPRLYNIYVGKKDIYRKTMNKFYEGLKAKGYDCSLYMDNGGHQWPQWLSFASSFMVDISSDK